MAKVAVYNMEGKEVDSIELNDSIFGVEINEHLVHMAVLQQLANNRQGTQKAKTRSEVRGGGRKPWRQKGTGHARQGSTRSPQWTGGGVVFAPVPRDYSFKLNKKEKRAALKSVLTSKVAENKFVVVDELKLDEIKTKKFVQVIDNLKSTGDRGVLFEQLRRLRTQMAKEEQVPPFVIFSDATLEQMAAVRPVTRDELRQISGVGVFKLEKYGERFLKLIRDEGNEETETPREENKNLAGERERGEAACIYDYLVSVRNRMADDQGIKPFQILSNRTLMDMSFRRPSQESEIKAVYGIGPAKFDKFGLLFLNAVQEAKHRLEQIECTVDVESQDSGFHIYVEQCIWRMKDSGQLDDVTANQLRKAAEMRKTTGDWPAGLGSSYRKELAKIMKIYRQFMETSMEDI